MEASAPLDRERRARAAGVAAARALARRAAAVRCDHVLLRRLPLRVLLSARARHQRPLQDRPRTNRRSAMGAAIAGLLLRRGDRLPSRRAPPVSDVLLAGIVALVMTLAAVALQFYEYTTLGFGAASGGYAAVFFGWTAWYAVLALVGAYWIEIQVASLLRERPARASDARGARACPPTTTSCCARVSRHPPSTGPTSWRSAWSRSSSSTSSDAMDLGNWSWDPSLFYVVPAALLYCAR